MIERLGLAILHRIEPEAAHRMSLLALGAGLVALPGPVTSARLRTRLAGLDLPNPVGLAAGYDKDAVAIGPLMRAGFGFLEVGAATPRAQPGNDRPRVFRLAEDRAVINRFGFNNEGASAIAARLAARPAGVPVGINLGANRDSGHPVEDFAQVLAVCGPHADFATINVSSPNTAGLRQLQAEVALRDLLGRVAQRRDGLGLTLPIFLKISPDLSADEIDAVAGVALDAGVGGIIATNTTLARAGLTSRHAAEAGGLSGRPLFRRSTQVLARLSVATQGRLPLIGVGGIATAEDAWQKIRAGASAVQLYTGLVYGGLSLARRIARGLDALLAAEGFATVADAVGTGRDDWL